MKFEKWLKGQMDDITTDGFANVIGVSRPSVSAWLNGRSFPNVRVWYKIASWVAKSKGRELSDVLIEMSECLN